MASWKNRPKLAVILKRIPPSVKSAVAAKLEEKVGELVEAQKRAAPVTDDLQKQPGQFRDSIHSYPNPDRELSYRVIADARDAKGNFIGPHIEHGHLAVDGSHVAAKPSFFPTYRAWKKPAQKAIRKAGLDAFKSAGGGLVK